MVMRKTISLNSTKKIILYPFIVQDPQGAYVIDRAMMLDNNTNYEVLQGRYKNEIKINGNPNFQLINEVPLFMVKRKAMHVYYSGSICNGGWELVYPIKELDGFGYGRLWDFYDLKYALKSTCQLIF